MKHSGRRALTEADLTPVWLTADGVASLSGHELPYEELAEAVHDVAELAERFQDPAGVAQEAREKVELPGDGAAEETT